MTALITLIPWRLQGYDSPPHRVFAEPFCVDVKCVSIPSPWVEFTHHFLSLSGPRFFDARLQAASRTAVFGGTGSLGML
jgi:hypothetical protein